jgi:hypothetical protein
MSDWRDADGSGKGRAPKAILFPPGETVKSSTVSSRPSVNRVSSRGPEVELPQVGHGDPRLPTELPELFLAVQKGLVPGSTMEIAIQDPSGDQSKAEMPSTAP